jgi:predicted O-linked N-acetylglucosamine transferase (SPINDLY family)
LALALQDRGEVDAAISAFQQALALKPDFVSAHTNLFLCLHYSPAFDATALFSEARRFNACHARPVAQTPVHHDNERSPQRRLRLGYVSGGFRRHPIGYFFLPVFMAHDKQAFEIMCYAGVRKPDEMTEQFVEYADCWFDVRGVSDEDLAQQIRADDIDILVDLSGHQGGNRLLVFARKPAPVQVSRSYDTTGLDAMDYFLSDRFHTPAGTDRYFSEQLVRLPNGYVCYAPPDYAPPVTGLPARENGYITFGCFNGLAKITPEVVRVWAQILQRLPSATIKLTNTDCTIVPCGNAISRCSGPMAL